MSGLGQWIGQQVPALAQNMPSLFGPNSTPLDPGSGPVGNTSPIIPPTSSSTQADQQAMAAAASSTPVAGSSVDPTGAGAAMDPLTQALIKSMTTQNKLNPWMALATGLGPLGAALLDPKREFAGLAPESRPSTSIPPPLQFAPPVAPTSPISNAALIAELL